MNEPKWKIVENAVKKSERKVGIEVEGLLLNKDGEPIVPPKIWPRDGFPLLLEIRSIPGENAADTYSNFVKAKMEIEKKPREGNSIVYRDLESVRLSTYKEALKQVTEAKGESIGKTKNIYGINVEDFSDQILKAGKIQGVNVSCGLHIHFSMLETDEIVVEEPVYEHVLLPLETIPLTAVKGEVKGLEPLMTHLVRPSLSLYRYTDNNEKKTLRASVSQLNRPTIEWMVKEMDDHLFKKFAPEKDKRTKYRQPGYYELKPHGFEYRSLPANDATLAALPEIINFAFDLMDKTLKF